MITISLDEYGDFEEQNRKPLMIAGIMFDDGNKEYEINNERKRIRAYYKKVLSEAGPDFRYPEDLHSNSNKRRDKEVITFVKDKVSSTLGEFMKMGTYNGAALMDDNARVLPSREGKYHLFVYLKSVKGKTDILSRKTNMLVRDDYASNLYFHMAESVVHRIILNNPFYSDQNKAVFSIDLASRSTKTIEDMDEEKRQEYISQGYREKEIGNDEESKRSLYTVMNVDIYRTLLADEMSTGDYKNIDINWFNVRSITYKNGANNQEFLYLADSICSVLGYGLNGCVESCLGDVLNRVDTYNKGNGNLVFCYDRVDNYYNKAWDYYKEGNSYETLSVIYDAEELGDAYALYYKDRWFADIKKRLRETVDPNSFSKSIDDLNRILYTNNLNQNKLLYLLNSLEELAHEVAFKYRSVDNKARMFYKLYETGMSAYCHIGETDKAMEYYEKCKEYAPYIDAEAYLRTHNKLAVCLEDSFDWDRAEEIAEETVSFQELISDMKRSIFNTDDEYMNEAKAISQYARILALKRDDRTIEKFRSALQKLEKGSSNYKITQSYLLHHLADMGMKDEFETELTDYTYGASTYDERLKRFIFSSSDSDSNISKPYALYVIIKGLYYFADSQEISSLWKKIKRIDAELKQNDGALPSGHPWEIIYKYMEILAYKQGDKQSQEKFKELREGCLKYHGDIIYAIEQYGSAEVAEVTGRPEERDTITEKLTKYMKENFDTLRDAEFSEDGNKRYHELGEYFTFMYK